MTMHALQNAPCTATAVIIGRAGSKGLPSKNALMLAGRPMVVHSIEAARAAQQVARIIVSTDGEAIARAASECRRCEPADESAQTGPRDTEVVMRPAHLATDSATVAEAVRHAIESSGDRAPIVVILYANVPVRPNGLIDRAIDTLRATNADSVQSYSEVGKWHPYWTVQLDPSQRVTQFIANDVDRRQNLPPLYMPDGGVIAVRREALMHADHAHDAKDANPANAGGHAKPHDFLGRDRRGIINPHGSVVDIDSAQDLAVAEALLAQRAQQRGVQPSREAHPAGAAP